MKFHIDTIPVWDAIRQGEPCFLCTLARRAEQTWAERFLGASVMEPDWRIQVNARGFCVKHHQLLYGMGNRLGHALMLESHSAEASKTVMGLLAALKQSAEAMDAGGISRLSRGAARARASYDDAVGQLGRTAEDCILCARVAEQMESSVCSVLHLWKNDPDFQSAFSGCPGFCLPHLRDLLRLAPEMLTGRELPAFVSVLTRLEEKALGEVRENVSWFIKKFDYRYQAEPWKNARDAVPQAVNALRGWALPCKEEGPQQEGGG